MPGKFLPLRPAWLVENSEMPRCTWSGRLRYGLNGLDDVEVTRTAAEIAFEFVPNGLFIGMFVAREHIYRCHDHARRAEAALKRMMFLKGGLNGMEFAVDCEAFDCYDGSTVCLNGKHGAGFDRPAIQMHHTGAALAGITAHMGPGEAQMFAQKMHEQCAVFHFRGDRLAVHL